MMKRPAASIEGARVKESGFCISRNGLLATLAYPLLSFILYYTLALHLRWALGRWPESIGVDPGTALFRVHAWAAGLLFWLGFVIVPTAAALALFFAFMPRTRKWAVYLMIFLAACLAVFGGMQLAPTGFTNWWWD
jgi:hypothetical protein